MQDQAVRRPKQDENLRWIASQLQNEEMTTIATYLACLTPVSRLAQDICGSCIPLERLSHPLTW